MLFSQHETLQLIKPAHQLPIYKSNKKTSFIDNLFLRNDDAPNPLPPTHSNNVHYQCSPSESFYFSVTSSCWASVWVPADCTLFTFHKVNISCRQAFIVSLLNMIKPYKNMLSFIKIISKGKKRSPPLLTS